MENLILIGRINLCTEMSPVTFESDENSLCQDLKPECEAPVRVEQIRAATAKRTVKDCIRRIFIELQREWDVGQTSGNPVKLLLII